MPKCNKCNHTWQARTEHPKACPACKSYKWNEPKKPELVKLMDELKKTEG